MDASRTGTQVRLCVLARPSVAHRTTADERDGAPQFSPVRTNTGLRNDVGAPPLAPRWSLARPLG